MTTSWADPPPPLAEDRGLQRGVDAGGWPIWRDVGLQDLVLGLANTGQVVYLPSEMRAKVETWQAEADAARIEWALDPIPPLVVDP